MNSDDLGGLLHEEIERLPERYRAPCGPVRSRGTQPRAGGPASGMAARHGQEPSGAGAGTTPRSASPARPGSQRRLARKRSGAQRPDSRGLAGPGRIHDPLGRSICHLPDRRPSFDSHTCAGGSQSHVTDPMVQGRFGSARRGRDGLGRRHLRTKAGASGAASCRKQGRNSPRRRADHIPGQAGHSRRQRRRTRLARSGAQSRRVQHDRGSDNHHIDRTRGHGRQEGSRLSASSTRRRCAINWSRPRSRSRAPRSPIKTPRPTAKSPRSRVTEFTEGTFNHELNAVKGEVAAAAIGHPESREPARTRPVRPPAARRRAGLEKGCRRAVRHHGRARHRRPSRRERTDHLAREGGTRAGKVQAGDSREVHPRQDDQGADT